MVEYRYHNLSTQAGGMLRAARKRRGWTLMMAAAEIGCDFSYLCLLEKSRRAPSVAMAAEIIRGLKLNPDEATVLLRESVKGVGRDKAQRKTGAAV
jgi:transcriptional regulator with XRE-family HTH domain